MDTDKRSEIIRSDGRPSKAAALGFEFLPPQLIDSHCSDSAAASLLDENVVADVGHLQDVAFTRKSSQSPTCVTRNKSNTSLKSNNSLQHNDTDMSHSSIETESLLDQSLLASQSNSTTNQNRNRSDLDEQTTDSTKLDTDLSCPSAEQLFAESTDSGGSVCVSGQDNSTADQSFTDLSQDNIGLGNRDGSSKKSGALLGGLDGSKGSGDLAWASLPHSGKSGKSSAERKKKGSWYNVLNPTYKSRSDDFKKIFKDVDNSERLIVDYSCALQKDILVQGRLYISQSFVCFYANIFRWETVLTIRCKDVIKLTKEKTARVIPNAIQIWTKDEKYSFTSFGTRDKTYMILDRVLKTEQPMGAAETWQWIHYSYGEELGLTDDDDDYVCLSSDEKIQFQTRIQQKLAQGNENYDVGKEPCDDSLSVNDYDPLQPSMVLPVIGVDLNEPSELMDTISVNSAEECMLNWSNNYNDKKSSSHGVDSRPVVHLQLPFSNETDLDKKLDISTDLGDTTEDDEVNRCAEHSHFDIQVVDEIFYIPVEKLFEYCFTDSPLYQQFVKNKKTYDVVLSNWPALPDSTGVKVRNIAYTLSLNYSIGPKSSPSTERQIMYPESRPGHFYLIDTECINSGIPYGENFYVVNRFCISRLASNKSRLRITSQIKYRKSVWGLIKGFIDKNAAAGIIESFNVLADLLRQESKEQEELLAIQQNAGGCSVGLSRKKVLRRRRISDRSSARRPSLDILTHPNNSQQSTPVKHIPSRVAVIDKIKGDWHVKLTIDILVRVVCAVLIMLMIFNAVLFYKLWSLESTAANIILNKHAPFSSSTDRETPYTNEDWAKIFSRQQSLHESEMDRWKEVLSTSIQLMDQMIQALIELRSGIDQKSAYTNDYNNSARQPSST